MYVLESGDQMGLPDLPVPFSQFFLSSEGVLCRYWPSKKNPIAQYVIIESQVLTVLHLVHDAAVAGHPGVERTLTAACKHNMAVYLTSPRLASLFEMFPFLGHVLLL